MAHLRGDAKRERALALDVTTGIEAGETGACRQLLTKARVRLSQERHVDVVAYVRGALACGCLPLRPALHQISGVARLLEGPEGVWDHEFAERQPGPLAVVAKHLRGESLRKPVGREIRQSLRAGPFSPLEKRACEDHPAASGSGKARQHTCQVVTISLQDANGIEVGAAVVGSVRCVVGEEIPIALAQQRKKALVAERDSVDGPRDSGHQSDALAAQLVFVAVRGAAEGRGDAMSGG